MQWTNIDGWREYESIEHPLFEHYDERECFDGTGEWVASKTDGYDFKGLDRIGYIHHWDTREGEKEYILRVPIARFNDLFNDYLHGEGRRAMEEYDEWYYKDGVYLATRIV